jgi:transposase
MESTSPPRKLKREEIRLILQEGIFDSIHSGISIKDTAQSFEISESTIFLWIRKWKKSGNSDPRPKPPKQKTLRNHSQNDMLFALLQSGGTIKETASVFGVSPAYVHYWLKKWIKAGNTDPRPAPFKLTLPRNRDIRQKLESLIREILKKEPATYQIRINRWDAPTIAQILNSNFGFNLNPNQIYRLARIMGINWAKEVGRGANRHG